MNPPKVLFRVHAVQRMFERKVSVRNISQALQSGITIEDYSSEMPEPSRLILGYRGKHPFHIVTSESSTLDRITIITVYIPDPDKWTKDFMVRRT